MKKSIRMPILGFLLLCMTSCNWQVPQKVSVKTQAEYEFSLGDALFSAVNTEEIFGQFNLKTMVKEGIQFQNSQVYDYLPKKNEEVQKFIIKIPVQEIPINFSEYMNGSDFASAMNAMQVDDTVIEIPSITDSDTVTPISDISGLHKGIGALLTAAGNSDDGKLTYSAKTAGKGTFTSIKVKSGKYIIKGSFPLNARVQLYSSSSNPAAYFDENGKAVLDITGFEFTANTQLNIQGTGGTYAAYIDPESTFEISYAKDVTYNEAITLDIDPVNFELMSKEDAKDFVEAQIGEGKVDVSLKYPSSWTGISAEYNVALSGSLTVPSEKISGELNLADKVISGTEKTVLNAKTDLKLNNANIDFSSNASISVVTKSTVSSFKYVIVKFSDSESLHKSDTKPLPEDFMKTVKTITLLSSGISGAYVNTLPAGNDIKLTVSSTFLGINDSAVLTAGTETGNYSVKSPADFKADRVIGTETGKFDSIDFDVKITLPGSTEDHPEQIKLANVKPNDSYTISIKIDPEIDYEQLTISTADYAQQDTQELGLNLSSLFSQLEFGGVNIGEKLQLESLPVYLMAVKPSVKNESGDDMFESAQFRGHINLFMGKEGLGQNGVAVNDAEGKPASIRLLGNADGSAGTLYMGSIPSLGLVEDTITVKFDEVMKGLGNKVISHDLTEILNRDVGEDSSLYLSYDMEFTNGSGNDAELTIKKDQLDEAESSSIAVVAFIELPLTFKVVDDIDMKIIESEATENTASTEPANKDSTVEKLTGIIQDAKIEITPTALPFIANPPMVLHMSLTDKITTEKEDGTGGFKLSVGTTNTLRITGSTVSSLVDTLSSGSGFSPNVSIEVPKGIISIPREMDFKANVILGMRTNGEIELYPNLMGGN